MSLLFYNLFLFVYESSIRIAALFNQKARKWVEGRRDILNVIKSTLPHHEERIWMHCSSLGEFEQGRPLLEELKKQYPKYKIVLTFFSPSGYEVRKDYELADYVFYLPMDGFRASSKFIRLVNPALAVFVKYEFWYYYLKCLDKSSIPTILIAASFRKDQHFFKWYGGLFRLMLTFFDYLFVVDDASQRLLAGTGITNQVIVAGDTRYDRVVEIAKAAKMFPLIEQFMGSTKLLIAGSTWPDDEHLLMQCMDVLPSDWKVVIAPHEVDEAHIQQISALFPKDAVRYSQLDQNSAASRRILVIDNIGMLASCYHYGSVAYIGGGFQKGGIHNTLEPAVFGLPVIFGPVYRKFIEANLLVDHQFAFPISNASECRKVLEELPAEPSRLSALQFAIRLYVKKNIGATGRIIDRINSERFL